MRSAEELDYDQIAAIDYLYNADQCMLIAETGAGKSVIALSAMMALKSAALNTRFLVVAPLKVCASTWANEAGEWSDLAHLRVGIAAGDPVTRQRIFKNIEDYDIVVVNFEQMEWMSKNNHFKHFDGLVVDEGSKFKAGAKYFKLLRKHLKNFTWRVLMTGTLISESYVDLFYQAYVIGDGIIFGRNKQKWLDKYFYSTDYHRRKWDVRPDMIEKLVARIKPYLHVMPAYKSDTLPPLMIVPQFIDMPDNAWKAYKSMAGKLSYEGIEAANLAVKMGKLQQICGGWLYSEDEVLELHTLKMGYLDKIVKSDTTGKLLLVYSYDVELERIQEAYPGAVVMPSKAADVDLTVKAWNSGLIDILVVNPRNSGHGLNLQNGGFSIVWMSPVWSLDQFDQLNSRLWRRGQTNPVTVYLLLMKDTIESDVIIPRLEMKAELLPNFLTHVQTVCADADEDRQAYPH